MKNKYQCMNNAEKKELKKAYTQQTKGKIMLKRLTRLFVTGIIGIVLALILGVSAHIDGANAWDYISNSILLLISLFFTIRSQQLKVKILNEYSLKK